MDKLAEVQGYKHVFAALQSIEQVSAVKKTEQFDRFFEWKRGQPLDVYIRTRRQDWADLQDLDEGTKMSDDLLAYFFLKHSGLSKEDRPDPTGQWRILRFGLHWEGHASFLP